MRSSSCSIAKSRSLVSGRIATISSNSNRLPILLQSTRNASSSSPSLLRSSNPIARQEHLNPLSSDLFQLRSLTTSAIRSAEFLSPLQEQQSQDADAVIVGAGVVGLALACSMANSSTLCSRPLSYPFRLVIVETSSLTRIREWGRQKKTNDSGESSREKQDWENRVVSLSEENLQWLKNIGVYEHLIPSRLRPVRSMKVWDGLSGAEINFDSEGGSSIFPSSAATSSYAEEPLSTMVELNNLQQAMLSFLDSRQPQSTLFEFQILEETKVQDILPGGVQQEEGKIEKDPWPLVQVSASKGGPDTSSPSQTLPLIKSRLLIGADGKNSPVRAYARIGTYGWSYDRKGLVGTMRCEESNPFLFGEEEQGHTAWQRFLPTGPIAWLPLSQTAGSLVWTLPPRIASALTTLHRETSAPKAGEAENGEQAEAEPLAQLVNAAYRLPWQELEELLERVCELAETTPSTSSSTTPRNWSFLSHEISAAYFRNGLQSPPGSVKGSASFQPSWGAGESSSLNEHPPAVLSLDSRSVAVFPLQLSHADSYLGSSLNAHMESRLPIAPSRILDFGLSLAGLKPPTPKPHGQSMSGRGRTVLVGDAAHSIHPLAGQGLNLGLADARSLCKTLEEATRDGADIGAHHSLTAYSRDRYVKNQAIMSGTDHLHWIYKYGAKKRKVEGEEVGVKELVEEKLGDLWVWGRSTAVEVLNELEPVKKAMMQRAGSGKRR